MAEKRKMLVVDDIQMNLDLFTADFEEEFDVVTARSGMAGLEMAVKMRPDIILLDINMPDISGVEVMRRLALRPETARIPVVVITAAEHNTKTHQLLKPFPSLKGFMSKMDSSENILETVNKALAS